MYIVVVSALMVVAGVVGVSSQELTTVQIQPVARGTFPRLPCITVFNATNGAPVVVNDCSASTEQRGFTFSTSPGPVSLFGNFCLDVTNGVDADGTKLQIWTCVAGNTNQLFVSNTDGTIEWSGHGKCLDLTNGNLTNGNPIQVWDCITGNTNQLWSKEPLANPLAEVVNPATGVCLATNTLTNGSPVFVTACNDTSALKVWKAAQIGHGNTGTYEISGDDFTVPHTTKCLDVTNGVAISGTKLQIWDCVEGNTNQQWFPTLEGNVQLEASPQIPALCLDLTNGNVTSGNQVQIWNCTNGNINQLWSDTPPPQLAI